MTRAKRELISFVLLAASYSGKCRPIHFGPCDEFTDKAIYGDAFGFAFAVFVLPNAGVACARELIQ